MNLSQTAVRRPIAVSVGVIVVLIFGLLSLNNLGLDLFPDWQFPYVTIATVYPAADPQTVEEEVTRVVEGMVSTVSGLRRVQSTSMENMSVVTAEFGWGSPIEQTLEEIRGNLSALALLLPPDAQPPFVTAMDPAQLPVMIIGLTSSQGAEHTTARAISAIRPAFEQVPGVAQVTMLGGVQREIQVLYDSDKLEEHGLTPAMLQQMLSLQNALVPAGIIESNGARFHTRVGNHFTNVQEIRDLVIGESRLPVQGLAALWPPLLYVKDVADVVDGFKASAGSARIAGEDTVLLQVLKRPDANTVQVARALKRSIDGLQQTAPDISISIITDQSTQIVSSLNNLALFGSFGALLAIGVLFLFLRTWRSILIIATAIPLSVVVTVACLYFTDLSLNVMTLGGLSLGVGMLVDNAIIVLESIFRHSSQGAGPTEAAIAGSKEVSGAVVAATATTVVVFLPVLFMETFAARLFRELGLTVSLSLFSSLIVSLTVIPAMAGRLLHRGTGAKQAAGPDDLQDGPPDGLQGGLPDGLHDGLKEAAASTETGERPPTGRLDAVYERALGWALNHKSAVLAPLVVLVGLSAVLWPQLGLQFLPDSPTRSVYISMETEPGTLLSRSEAVAAEAVRRLDNLGAWQFVTVQVGEQHQDDMISILSDHRPTSIKLIAVGKTPFYGRRLRAIIDASREALADLPVQYVSVSGAWESDANLFSSDIVLQVSGNNYDNLQAVALALDGLLRTHPAVAEVHVSLTDEEPEMYLAVDQSRALIGGLTTGQISLAVRHALTGVQATQVRQGGQTIPVVLRPRPENLTNLDDLLNFRVSSPVVTGLDDGSVRLGNVVEAHETAGPQTIRHVDGARVIEVRVKPAGANLRQVNAAVSAALQAVDMPAGVSVHEAGVMEHIDQSLGELAFALLFALILVYLVMVVQFESWREPLIILITAPLAAAGVLWALRLTNTSVSVMPLLGLIILGGIVVNNGILLVDYMGRLRQQGSDVRRAVIVGARTRLRPVLMTATTTIGGMLPLALSQGEGMEMQGPLAVTVIGGLLASTMLTLLVVPLLYALLHESRPRPADRLPATKGPVIISSLLATALLLTVGLAGPVKSVRAQTDPTTDFILSKPTVAAGIGYDADTSGPAYMLGAGWGAYVRDIDWTLFVAAAAVQERETMWVFGARGNWFQPISFAGYFEVDGELSVRQLSGGNPSTSLSLTGDAVLGNLTARIEYDHIGAGFPALPWDVPGRLPVLAKSPHRRRLRGELRQQPNRELNLVREFQWGHRADNVGGPGSLLIMTGAEIRAAGGWLGGKVGVHVRDKEWQPTVEIGLRLRPDVHSELEIKAASATVWSAAPTLTAVYNVNGPTRAYNVRLTLQPDNNNVLTPSLILRSEPHRGGMRWQVALDAADKSQATSFGVFTTF